MDVLLEQTGVIRANSIDDLFHMAAAFSHQPLPKGNRMAILTNAGGPAIMATDFCVNLGLALASFHPSTTSAMKKVLRKEAALSNPVDMIAEATPQNYRKIMKIILDDPGVDALLVIFVSPIMIDAHAVAKAIAEAAGGATKPILCCFMGKVKSKEGIQELEKAKIPIYSFPEHAIEAIAAMNIHRQWRDRPRGKTPRLDVDKKTAEEIFLRAVESGKKDLDFPAIEALLKAYRFPVAPSHLVRTLEEAIDAAHKLQYPVVLKSMVEAGAHKTDTGGVFVDLRNVEELVKAFKKFKRAARGKKQRALVQKMVAGGREVILGVKTDPKFGSLILFGLGGIYVEVMKDIVIRIHPLTDLDAKEMIRGIKGYPFLRGVRGEPPVNEGVLIDCLMRLSKLLSDFPFIEEMDINPLIAGTSKEDSFAVDARIRINPQELGYGEFGPFSRKSKGRA